MWQVIQVGDSIQILPVSDLKSHSSISQCSCHPAIEPTDNKTLVIHRAYDGREFSEQAHHANKPIVIIDRLPRPTTCNRYDCCEPATHHVLLNIDATDRLVSYGKYCYDHAVNKSYVFKNRDDVDQEIA